MSSQSPAFEQYPVKFKQMNGVIDGNLTNVSCTSFADKIMVTITQEGRLAQWIQVPLEDTSPTFAEERLPSSNEDSLLPMTHLLPKTLLGVSNPERETMGQLYATQIASAMITRDPDERRPLLIGLGLSKTEANRQIFFEVIDLVLKCI